MTTEGTRTMTRATEYMIAEHTADGRTVPMAHCGSWYSDRWYGDGDNALTGDAAVWRAVQQVADAGPGMFTAVKVRTFNRAPGHGLVGNAGAVEVPAAGTVVTSSAAHQLRAWLVAINPVWRVAAALTAATAYLLALATTSTGRDLLDALARLVAGDAA